MKFGKYFIALIFAVTFAAPSFSQDANMELNSKELGVHQRPIVNFSHEKHSQMIECLRCHHNFDEFGNNTGSEGQACSECHSRTVGTNPVPLDEAFHVQCKVCHEHLRTKGTTSGPVMCGECHVRK